MAIKPIPPPLQTIFLDDNGLVAKPWANFFNQIYRIQSETVWDDIRTPLSNSKKVVGKEAKDKAYRATVVTEFEVTANQAIAFIVQVPHKYKIGSDIEFHIHYILPSAGSGAGAENVKWDLTYSWADMGSSQPVETTASKTIDVQDKAADTHYYGGIVEAIDGSGKDISSQILCSLTRDVGVAGNFADSVYVTEVDFHFQLDTLGSSQEAIK